MTSAERESPKKAADLPVRMFKLLTPGDDALPVDLGSFAVHAADGEWFYPPGGVFESKKESMDSVGQDEETGEELSSKMLEVAVRLPRPLSIKVAKGKDGSGAKEGL